jgi:hypothetical protein
MKGLPTIPAGRDFAAQVRGRIEAKEKSRWWRVLAKILVPGQSPLGAAGVGVVLATFLLAAFFTFRPEDNGFSVAAVSEPHENTQDQKRETQKKLSRTETEPNLDEAPATLAMAAPAPPSSNELERAEGMGSSSRGSVGDSYADADEALAKEERHPQAADEFARVAKSRARQSVGTVAAISGRTEPEERSNGSASAWGKSQQPEAGAGIKSEEEVLSENKAKSKADEVLAYVDAAEPQASSATAFEKASQPSVQSAPKRASESASAPVSASAPEISSEPKVGSTSESTSELTSQLRNETISETIRPLATSAKPSSAPTPSITEIRVRVKPESAGPGVDGWAGWVRSRGGEVDKGNRDEENILVRIPPSQWQSLKASLDSLGSVEGWPKGVPVKAEGEPHSLRIQFGP